MDDTYRRVILSGAGYREPLGNIPLIMKDDFALSIATSYTNLFDVANNKYNTAISSVLSSTFKVNISASLPHSSFQIWDNTNPIIFQIPLVFYMGIADLYDAKKEVYDPVLKLQRMSVPYLPKDGFGLVPVGASPMELLSLSTGGNNLVEKVRTQLSESVSDEAKNQLAISIGNLYSFSSVLITNVDVTWNKEVQKQADSGKTMYYPISADVAVSFMTSVSAHSDMLFYN